MKTRILSFFVLLLIATQISSCNLWKDFADPSEKEAIIEEAKFLMDSGEYLRAVSLLDLLILSYPDDTEVATLRSSAYTGAAGIGLMDIGFNMSSLSTGVDVSASPFVPYLALVEAPTNTELLYALEARNSLIGFSSSASLRTNEMNMYLTILSYGIVATTLSARADTSPNDNETDEGFDCSSISDEDVLEIIYTYAIAKDSIAYADGSSLWEGIESTVQAFTTALETLSINLSITNKSEITNAECLIMKNFLVGGLKGAPEICTCSI